MEKNKQNLKLCKKCGGKAELLIKCSFKGYFCYGKCKNCGRKSKKIYMNYLLGIVQQVDIQKKAKEEWNKKNSERIKNHEKTL